MRSIVKSIKSSKAAGPPKAAEAHDRVLAETPPHQRSREKLEAKAPSVPANGQRLNAYDSPSSHQRYDQESELLRL